MDILLMIFSNNWHLKIQTYDTFIRYNSILEKEEYVKEHKLKSMEIDLFLEKINDEIFTNIPEDFNHESYKEINSLEYCNCLDIKIHYELVGFYKKLEYIKK